MLSKREKVTGRVSHRQIGSTKRGDRYADFRLSKDSPSTDIFATQPVTASGHPGNHGYIISIRAIYRLWGVGKISKSPIRAIIILMIGFLSVLWCRPAVQAAEYTIIDARIIPHGDRSYGGIPECATDWDSAMGEIIQGVVESYNPELKALPASLQDLIENASVTIGNEVEKFLRKNIGGTAGKWLNKAGITRSFASCVPLAVRLPSDAVVEDFQLLMTTVKGDLQHLECQLDIECSVGWSIFKNYREKVTSVGKWIYVTAVNWHDDLPRGAMMVVTIRLPDEEPRIPLRGAPRRQAIAALSGWWRSDDHRAPFIRIYWDGDDMRLQVDEIDAQNGKIGEGVAYRSDDHDIRSGIDLSRNADGLWILFFATGEGRDTLIRHLVAVSKKKLVGTHSGFGGRKKEDIEYHRIRQDDLPVTATEKWGAIAYSRDRDRAVSVQPYVSTEMAIKAAQKKCDKKYSRCNTRLVFQTCGQLARSRENPEILFAWDGQNILELEDRYREYCPKKTVNNRKRTTCKTLARGCTEEWRYMISDQERPFAR